MTFSFNTKHSFWSFDLFEGGLIVQAGYFAISVLNVTRAINAAQELGDVTIEYQK